MTSIVKPDSNLIICRSLWFVNKSINLLIGEAHSLRPLHGFCIDKSFVKQYSLILKKLSHFNGTLFCPATPWTVPCTFCVLQSLLDSHRQQQLEVDFPAIDNQSHSSDYGGSFKGSNIPIHAVKGHSGMDKGFLSDVMTIQIYFFIVNLFINLNRALLKRGGHVA